MINFLKHYNRNDPLLLQLKEAVLDVEEKRLDGEKLIIPIVTNAIPAEEPKVEEPKIEPKPPAVEEVLTIDEALSEINKLADSVRDFKPASDDDEQAASGEDEQASTLNDVWVFKNEQGDRNEH